MKKLKHLKSIIIPTIAATTLAATTATAIVLIKPNKQSVVNAELNAVTQHTITFSTDAHITTETTPGTKVGDATLSGKTSVKIKSNRTFGSVEHPIPTLEGYEFSHWAYINSTLFKEIKSTDRISSDLILYPIFVAPSLPYIDSDQCWIQVPDSKTGYAQLDLISLCNPSSKITASYINKTDSTEKTLTYRRNTDQEGTEELFDKAVTFGHKMTIIPPCFLEDCTAFNQKIEIPANIKIISDYFLAGCISFKNNDEALDLTNSTGLSYISSYFMDGCTSFNKDIKLPKSVAWVNVGFMHNCNAFTSKLDLTNYDETAELENIFTDNDFTLSSDNASSELYLTGAQIETSHTTQLQTFLGTFQNLTGQDDESKQFRNLGVYKTDSTGVWDLYVCAEGAYIAGLNSSQSSWPAGGLPSTVKYEVGGEDQPVKQLAAGAFDRTTKTQAQCVPATLTIPYGSESDYQYVPKNCFKGCTQITSITFTNAPTQIAPSAFEGCSGLTSIDLHAATVIGSKAFSGCTALADITINEDLYKSTSYIGEAAFGATGSAIASTGTIAIQDSLGITQTLSPTSWALMAALIKQHSSIETIAKSTGTSTWVMDCSGDPIIDVVDPSTFVIDENGVLSDLGDITPSSANILIIPAEVTAIADSCALLKDHAQITTIMFEEGSLCTTIGDWSMTSSTLKYIDFTNAGSLTTIGDGAFADCSSLVSKSSADETVGIIIPASVTRIKKNAFLGCHALKLLDLSAITTAATAVLDTLDASHNYEGILYDAYTGTDGTIKKPSGWTVGTELANHYDSTHYTVS